MGWFSEDGVSENKGRIQKIHALMNSEDRLFHQLIEEKKHENEYIKNIEFHTKRYLELKELYEKELKKKQIDPGVLKRHIMFMNDCMNEITKDRKKLSDTHSHIIKILDEIHNIQNKEKRLEKKIGKSITSIRIPKKGPAKVNIKI